ncbi:hypothetical protein V6N12_065430 [Hibiscus sabdariffa]|uniref:Uncharacterized protein n=1 Tax=Hibiscus sabdariffa TaxID=183260 RepID=A0ABR2G8W7_9ROSI
MPAVPAQAEQGHLEVARWTPRLHSIQADRRCCLSSSHSRCAGTRPPRGGEPSDRWDSPSESPVAGDCQVRIGVHGG